MSDKIDFTGRVAIVTGAGSGLGRAYALDLAARGAAVIVNDIGTGRDGIGHAHGPADLVVKEICAAGGKAVASYDSVDTESGGAAITALALKEFGRVDSMISNAGILRNAAFEDLKNEDITSVLTTSLLGAFHVCMPAYRVMQRQNYGRIVLISSASGLFGTPWQANYAAAKAALIGLSAVIAMEGAAYGILCNAVLPFAKTRAGSRYSESFIAEARDIVAALGEHARPESVVPLVTYLSSALCQRSQSAYSAIGGRYARIVLGVTEGWHGDGEITAEMIAANIDRIDDCAHIAEPKSVLEEIALAAGQLGKRA